MKKLRLYKILYVLVCVFLLCNFYSAENTKQQASHSLSKESAISFFVPHGIFMEIKGEETPAGEAVTVKPNAQKTVSLFRYLVFLSWISAITYGAIWIYRLRSNSARPDTLFLTIQYIHDTDGRKRR